MLYVTWSERQDTDANVGGLFETVMENEWFDDSFVKDLVKEIDNSTVYSALQIDSPILGPIGYRQLSGGVKCLIMMYKVPQLEQWGSFMGDNCMDAMFRIGKLVDVHVRFSHFPKYDRVTSPVHAYFEQTDVEVFTKEDFEDQMVDAALTVPRDNGPYNS